MSVAWAASSFSYYMVSFYYKYIPGDIFSLVIVASFAEGCAALISGFIATYIGTKNTLFAGFLIGGFFGAALAVIPPESTAIILVCLLLTKAGVAAAFNLCYLVTAEYFPVVYTSTVFGACNIFARITTIFAPLIAEIKAPIPMIFYTIFCLISMLGTTVLTKTGHYAMKTVDEALISASPRK